MLEARNLTKEYTTKDGPVVKALDNVNIKFEETGMVFILGKSGSGKSTLLNVLGGLDKYDEGEVIVKGKSSKDFKQADFDSYRNTFVGFIFQDYNILEEFTISKNIGLALELQGKKADKNAIDDLLKQVDLLGFAKRKPNSLSGGQKQRVAIARALVKNPEIIMADEPTGALDSNTGKQVLDTLKELSKTKLVLVVSHDKEFAEYYGDRIIELADGKVISDVKKYKSAPKVNDGLEIVDDKILTIKKGTKLDAKKTKVLNDFILNTNDDVIVSIDSKANKEFKKFAMIDDKGNKESFKVTDDLDIKDYNPDDFKLIKSKLPNKDSFKMGASGLKSKPVRLFFTILLSAVAFALFGLADTMGSYDKVENTIKSMKDTQIDYVSFSKKVIQSGGYTTDAKLSESDYAKLTTDLPTYNMIPVFNIGESYGSYIGYYNHIYSKDTPKLANGYYTLNLYGGVELTNNNISLFGELVGGKIPTSDDEIVVTKYVYDSFNEGGYTISSAIASKKNINSYDDLIGCTLNLNGETFKIVGILDTKIDLTRYEDIGKENFGKNSSNSMSDYMKKSELDNFISTSYHSLAYLNEGYYDRNLRNNGIFSNLSNNDYIFGVVKENSPSSSDSITIFYNVSGFKSDSIGSDIIWKGDIKNTLNDNEIILTSNIINDLKFTINGVDVSGKQILSNNYKSTVFEGSLQKKLLELGISAPSGQEYFEISRLLEYFGDNFDNSEYKYNNIQEKNWESIETGYCYINNGLNECDAYVYTGIDNLWGIDFTYNKETNMVLYDGDNYPVVDNTFTIRNIKFTINFKENLSDEYNKVYEISVNKGLYNFIEYYGKDLTQSQKDSLESFLKNFTIEEQYNLKKEILNSSSFDELYEYRTSKTGLEENWSSKETYANFLLQAILGTNNIIYTKYASITNDESVLVKSYRKLFVEALIDSINDSIWLNISKENDTEYEKYKIVGIYLGDNPVSEYNIYAKSYGLISNSIYDMYTDSIGGVYNFAIGKLDENNDEQISEVVKYTYSDNGKVIYYLNNTVMNSITQVNSLIETLSKVFLYIGIGFAVFASLLLLNFITISISYKKREIGVLRAIGARGMDVFRIFFNEAFIIAFINFVLALIACVSVCSILNGVLRNDYGVLITILNVGIRQVVLMFAVSLLVAFISSFFPVKSIARKKPIDAIRNS